MSEKKKEEKNENIKQEEKLEKKQETKRETKPAKEKELEELTDRYKRVLAEFENYKKRSQKVRESLYNSILADVVQTMLPVLDNLENAAKVETKD